MATKKITLNELRSIVKKIIKEETEGVNKRINLSQLENNFNKYLKGKTINVNTPEDTVTLYFTEVDFNHNENADEFSTFVLYLKNKNRGEGWLRDTSFVFLDTYGKLTSDFIYNVDYDGDMETEFQVPISMHKIVNNALNSDYDNNKRSFFN